jgi:hypothetical protein
MPEWYWDAGAGHCTEAASPLGSSPALLSRAFCTWVRDRPTADWDDAHRCGAILQEYSDLTLTEIAGLLGVSPDEIAVTPVLSGPPWTLSNPGRGGETVTIRRSTESEHKMTT